jgi:hypothetical protein
VVASDLERVRNRLERFSDGRHRKLHPERCDAWGAKARLGDETWEDPILAQLAHVELDDATIAAVVATLASDQKPVAIEKGRIERQLKELALDHVADRIDDTTYLERAAALRKQRDSLADGDRPAMAASRVVAWLRAFGDAILRADVAEERPDLIHAVYERIVVAGPDIVSARLTPEAYAGWRSRCRRWLWRARQDSNLRPSAPEADALSTELQARGPA